MTARRAPSLVAYHLAGRPQLEIVPAGRWRDWMEQADSRWPNRCLPLLMANQSGWWIINPTAFTATWDGGESPRSLVIGGDGSASPHIVESMFGYGIVTWHIPYMFRTEPGWNLLARGPVNIPRDGMAPLEGLVETDWATSTFTMNWKLTRPGSVRFEAGEVFCMLVPQRRHELESFEPVIAELAENPEANEGYQSWANLRDQLGILHWLSRFGTVEGLEQAEWQKHYFKGLTADGLEAPEHQTTRRLREFRLRGED